MPQKKIKNADYESRLLGSLLPLKNFLFVEKFGGRDNYSDRFEVQRATYSTLDDDDILNHQAFEYKDYNPNIVSVPLRATSGFMSYHYNPEDEFFGQRPVEFHSTIKKKKNTDVDKILAERTEDIHSVIQTSKNYMIQTQVMRDKIIFGVGGKTIDEDDYSLAKFNYYPPECLAYGSSSGLVPDIFGVKEKMTPFSIRMRFEGVEDEFERRPLGIDEQRIECYRFNVPKDVLKAHFEAAFSGDYDYKQMKKYWQKRFKISSGKTNRAAVPWVDFWFCDKAILAVSERATRNIIVSPFSLPTAAAGIGKGLGEIVQPLAFILAEIESIGLVAFERTYQPSYAIHEETAALGLDLSRDGMTIFSGDNRHAPQDLSLRANMQGVIEYKTLMESHYEKNFFLDVFDLINKSRMTRQEVSVRTMDNLRKAGLYVTCDETHDLIPTVNCINHFIHARLSGTERKSQTGQTAVNAKFTSPLAASHRTNVLALGNELVAFLTNYDKLIASGGISGDVVDHLGQIKDVVVKLGMARNLLPQESQEENTQRRKDMQDLEMDQAKANALAGVNNVLTAGQIPGNMGQNETKR